MHYALKSKNHPLGDLNKKRERIRLALFIVLLKIF